MNNNPVGWFEIYVQDIERTTKFYESVLGVKLEKLDSPTPDIEMMSFPMSMEGSGASRALAKMKDVPSGGSGTLVYFSCEDCAMEASRVEESGGRMHHTKFPIGEYGFIALAFDTEGNMFGLHSRQ